eukprot:TRINITY_DN38420_c0_g1_i1.p1 TRINITY_DN38420_c0_g1~~TRINITY_DN38420_c0_g1_i1.p1  ORF type:complete len:360 (-),score=49.88 TRINITY_DN38420_c0_g1_i1:59-1138(-)
MRVGARPSIAPPSRAILWHFGGPTACRCRLHVGTSAVAVVYVWRFLAVAYVAGEVYPKDEGGEGRIGNDAGGSADAAADPRNQETWIAFGAFDPLLREVPNALSDFEGKPRRARILTILDTNGANRSAVVVDGGGKWWTYARLLHLAALKDCHTWAPVRSYDLQGDVSAYVVSCDKWRSEKGTFSVGMLKRVKADESLVEVVEQVYGVDASSCAFGRGHKEGLLMPIQNYSMRPDSFHEDLCVHDSGNSNHRGLTLIVYPHDIWDAAWGGHTELAFGNRALAGIAPLHKRALIFDGCIEHRATNPTIASAPLRASAKVSRGLGQAVEMWAEDGEFDFREWRFAVVMQLWCSVRQKRQDL